MSSKIIHTKYGKTLVVPRPTLKVIKTTLDDSDRSLMTWDGLHVVLWGSHIAPDVRLQIGSLLKSLNPAKVAVSFSNGFYGLIDPIKLKTLKVDHRDNIEVPVTLIEITPELPEINLDIPVFDW